MDYSKWKTKSQTKMSVLSKLGIGALVFAIILLIIAVLIFAIDGKDQPKQIDDSLVLLKQQKKQINDVNRGVTQVDNLIKGLKSLQN